MDQPIIKISVRNVQVDFIYGMMKAEVLIFVLNVIKIAQLANKILKTALHAQQIILIYKRIKISAYKYTLNSTIVNKTNLILLIKIAPFV
ncbi:hypothetical protein TTHERM_000300368 (macronuclear) [Tetrahymena thermophila SB210]|uniref:Uncharacterized protein n=1 Tax=Tetrahymena thermophila (strain SB210) TaxID=312017 RepID=W7XG91_TETTS|nr:hypothetical protein TTHERM_000300368 [Tetrahymena thermophila SB210]EWS71864.1 hypothetical protein TTHERM_000300368 [Tetrahymena thermophila SB210]|eukprot:XP_012655608.1 hypothetical protein TTHERM_000300368 [Tetrahymena thermophila SB210]